MTDLVSSAELKGLLKAREWSIRLLLLTAVSVLAGVIYNIWFTVASMPQQVVFTASLNGGQDQVDLNERAVTFLVFGGNGPLLLPLVIILICGCFVLIHRPPLGGAGPLLWAGPSSRFAGLQGEVVGLGVLVGVLSLGYVGATVLGLTVDSGLMPLQQVRGICVTILVSSAATLCILGVLLTYWWILGIPRRVIQEA